MRAYPLIVKRQIKGGGGCQENTASAVPAIETGRWYQVAGVRSGNIAKLFLDGQKLQQQSVCVATTYTGNQPLTIGAFQDLGDTRFGVMNGSLDDIRIYNRALSDAEIGQLYAIERNPLPYLTVRVKTIRLSLFVTPGKTYQIESSSDAQIWSNYGSAFVAFFSPVFQDVDVLDGRQFFQIRELQ